MAACGRFQCCQAAISRSARQADTADEHHPPARLAGADPDQHHGALRTGPPTRRRCVAAPDGTTLSSTSRITPPPTAVMMPQIIAVSSLAPNSSALVVPETANSDRPPASSDRQHPVRDVRDRREDRKRHQRADQCRDHVPLIAERGRRDVADQQVPDDPATDGGDEPQHEHAEHVEVGVDRRARALQPEHERRGQVEAEHQSIGRDRQRSRRGHAPKIRRRRGRKRRARRPAATWRRRPSPRTSCPRTTTRSPTSLVEDSFFSEDDELSEEELSEDDSLLAEAAAPSLLLHLTGALFRAVVGVVEARALEVHGRRVHDPLRGGAADLALRQRVIGEPLHPCRTRGPWCTCTRRSASLLKV